MRRKFYLAAAMVWLAGCSPQSFFYYPNRQLYGEPANFGIQYDLLEYPSLNGKKLSGILMKSATPPKGVIVHFHGNYANLSNHFPQSVFLVKQGFDVLIFDYEGYGASEGRPSPAHMVEDGLATVRYAYDHRRNKESGVAVLGQSLGGAVAIVVAAKEPLVKTAVIEAAFAGYREMARTVLARSVWTWPLYPIAPLFIGKTYDPVRYVAQISPRALLFIHGDQDPIVPMSMSQELFEAARDPKEIWIVPGAGHINYHRAAGDAYDRRVGEFFAARIK